MKLRYIPLIALLLGAALLIQPALASWSIADPNDPNNTDFINTIEGKGYWNFPYDANHPITAAMYCCWWEQWYRVNKPYYDAKDGTSGTSSSSTSSSSLGTSSGTGSSSSVSTNSYPSTKVTNGSAVQTSAVPKVVTKAYCPCVADDAPANADFDAKSAVLLATKPWLKEGSSDSSSGKKGSSSEAVMTFSEAK